jgi:hypothetical protein
LQSDAFESELKVRQKERVPSRFNTRLWLYGLHGHVQSEAFRLIWSSTEELRAPYLNWRQDVSSDSIYGKVRLVLACFLGGQRNIKNLWLKSSWTGIQPNSRLRIRLELQINSILNWIWGLQIATERPLRQR